MFRACFNSHICGSDWSPAWNATGFILDLLMVTQVGAGDSGLSWFIWLQHMINIQHSDNRLRFTKFNKLLCNLCKSHKILTFADQTGLHS